MQRMPRHCRSLPAISQLAVKHLQVLNVGKGSGLAAILNIYAFEEGDYLVMLTKNGLIKRTPLSAFTAVRPSGLTAIKLKVRKCALCGLPSCSSSPESISGFIFL